LCFQRLKASENVERLRPPETAIQDKASGDRIASLGKLDHLPDDRFHVAL